MTKPFNPYETLGIPNDTTVPEARKAYRKRAKKTHPDAGGSAEAFAQASRAMAIIEDPERRHRYDQTGATEDEPVQSEWHAALSNIVPAISAAVMVWARDEGALNIEGRDVFADLIRKALAERHSQLGSASGSPPRCANSPSAPSARTVPPARSPGRSRGRRRARRPGSRI